MPALADLLPGAQAAALHQLRVQLRRAELDRLHAPHASPAKPGDLKRRQHAPPAVFREPHGHDDQTAMTNPGLTRMA